MAITEKTTEYVIFDPVDNTLMGRGSDGWINADTGLEHCKRWMTPENAQRHAYLDRFQDLPVTVTRKVEVTL